MATYKLERGAQQTLQAVLPQLANEIETWTKEAASGEISEGLRQVAVAFGWFTARDSRVKPIGRVATPATSRATPATVRPTRAQAADSATLPEMTS